MLATAKPSRHTVVSGGIVSVTRRVAPSPSHAMLARAAGSRETAASGPAGGPAPVSADTPIAVGRHTR